MEALGENFEKTSKSFIEFLLPDTKNSHLYCLTNYVFCDCKITMEESAKDWSENPDDKEFYLGMAVTGIAKSYKDLKAYKRCL